MDPYEFNQLPEGLRKIILGRGTAPSEIDNKSAIKGEKPYTTAGLPSLVGEYSQRSLPSNIQGVTYGSLYPQGKSRQSVSLYNPEDKSPSYTRAHEAEHSLMFQGAGTLDAYNKIWDELVGKNGASRETIYKRLVNHADYLQKNWGLPKADVELGYFSGVIPKSKTKEEEAYNTPENIWHEQIASLSAIQQLKNKRLMDDPYIRKNIFKTPAEREAFEAMTGLRQTRLDAKDLAPYTPVKGSTGSEDYSSKNKLMQKVKDLFGYASGGMVDAAGNKKLI